MSVISAGTTLTTALVQTGDTNGNLVFKTGASGTTALTLGSDQSATFAGAINFTGGTLTNPTINGNVTTTGLNFDSNTFVIDATNNRVGVGTASPAFAIQATNTSGSNFVSVVSSTTGTAGLILGDTDSAAVGRVEYANDVNAMTLYTNSTERMRIDSSGNVGIGTSTMQGKFNVSAGRSFFAANSEQYSIGVGYNQSRVSGVAQVYYLGATDSTTPALVFSEAGGAERMRLTHDGNLLVGTTGAGSKVRVETSDNAFGIYLGASNASYSSELITVRPTRNTTNSTFYAYSYYNTTAAAYRFIVYDSGNVANTNNSYGAISDIKVKENIVDATPKLEKLNQVRIVNYNLIGEDKKQIGVIAQELEQIFPGMIDETLDRDADGNVLETTTKTVKYSVFVPMLIKAIQEQQAIITDQASTIAAFEARLTALEGTK